jgi:hypothetical protein
MHHSRFLRANYNYANKNASVPDPLARLAKEWLYIKSIFLQLGCYRFYFSFPGMMADCMADLLRTKRFYPNKFFPD